MCVSTWLHFHLGTQALLALKAHFYLSEVKKRLLKLGKMRNGPAVSPVCSFFSLYKCIYFLLNGFCVPLSVLTSYMHHMLFLSLCLPSGQMSFLFICSHLHLLLS